jgi:xanthine dehydrogenase YagS FAD-binding subunit
MRAFEHWKASDLATTLSLLKEPGVEAYGGGTDLFGELKRGIRKIQRLINLKGLTDLAQISTEDLGGLRIGALCTLEEIALHPQIRNQYPSLIQAISTVATHQLRNMGTLGGNLCQHPRCWYFRNRLFPCWLKGGQKCFAIDGENPYHSVLGRGICQAVHPSDLAPALISLDARVRIAGQQGNREIPLEDFYRKPGVDLRQMTILQPGELITEVLIPKPPAGSRVVYLKSTGRKAWAFALASVAAQLVVKSDGGEVKEGRIVLGGVAPFPWRSKGAEQILVNQKLTEDTMIKAAEAALSEARPLRDNKYKVPMAKGLIRNALGIISRT